MRLLLPILLICWFVFGAEAAPAPAVLTFHGDPQRSGNTVVPSLTWVAAASMRPDTGFDGRVEGAVYAQPLYWRPPGASAGMLIVATESNTVQALDEATGRTIWRTVLGTPVPRSSMPCGNIEPLGITGTPVIDPAGGALFLDAMVDRGGRPAHLVFGLSLRNGGVLPGWPVDAGTALRGEGIAFTAREQNQRSALALYDGHVYVAYSGNWGDCGDYHGIVLGIATASPHAAVGWSTRALKGGIWAPGGVAEADGALFVATGNTEGAASWGDGEAVFRLNPGLRHSANKRDFFAPRNWKQLDDGDLDLGGVNPMPFTIDGAPRVLALGKDGNAYLLNRENLGGIGGQITVRRVANSLIITAPSFFPAQGRMVVVFQARRPACGGGLEALAVTAQDVAPLWCAPLDGRGSTTVSTIDGSAQPIVWVAGAEGDDRLHAFRGDTGAALWTSPAALPGLRHLVTPVIAGRHVYIAGDNRVYAFTWNPG